MTQNVVDIFLADTSLADESLERHWKLWSEVGWQRQPLRRYVELPTPAQEAAFPSLQFLDSYVYQPSRTAAPMLALFTAGTVLALFRPAWRPVLALALATLGLIGIHAATVGAVPRYRMAVEPLIYVVAMGALVVILGWLYGRLMRRSAHRREAL